MDAVSEMESQMIFELDPVLCRTIANYLLWRFVRHRVNNLDDRFQEAKQKFYYILFGREQAPSRWKNCVAQVNSNMGMAVGSMFVKKYFDEKSKNDVKILSFFLSFVSITFNNFQNSISVRIVDISHDSRDTTILQGAFESNNLDRR